MISRDTIINVAKLSKLEITNEETERFGNQLNAIIEYFDQLSKVDTANIEPLVAPSEVAQKLREDVVQPYTTVAEILKNAPEADGNLFRVPAAV